MSDQAGEKKFELSQRRRQKLREEGQIPRSQDISTSTTLIIGLGMMIGTGGLLIEYLREMMAKSFAQLGHSNLTLAPQTVGAVFTNGIWLWLGLFVGSIAIAVAATQIAQVGINFADDPFGPKFDKLNPINGVKNLFNVSKLVQTGQSLVKLGVVTAFAYFAIQEIQNSAVFSRPVNLAELGTIYVGVAWSLGWRIVTALAVLAGADYGFQLWKFNHDHMMTLEEVKEERRSQEMSPDILRKRRQMQRKVSMRRMMENLQDATIVVTNPTHYAVALRYKRGETEVPIVVAKGIRKAALRIKERAYDLRIMVREDRPLARGLYKYGKIDQPIPAIFYQGVAVILAQLYKQGFIDTGSRPAGKTITDAELDDILNEEND